MKKNCLFIHIVLTLAMMGCLSNEQKDASEIQIHCANKEELLNYEGDTVTVHGKYEFHKGQSFANKIIELKDSHKVVLVSDDFRLDTFKNGQELNVKGLVFTEQIPDKYNIIGRNESSYMVEVFEISICKK